LGEYVPSLLIFQQYLDLASLMQRKRKSQSRNPGIRKERSNMEKKSNWLALAGMVISLALLTGLAGCSRNPSDGTTSGDGDSNPRGQEDQTIITFAIDEWSRSQYEPLAEEFNAQNPDITVQMAIIPDFYSEDGSEEYNYARILATTADTAILWGNWSLSMGAGAYFRDLGPLIDSDASFQADDFWPGLLSACEDTQGRVIGIPVAGFMSGLYFDEQAFETAGVPQPTPGWTWEDFRRAASALARSQGGTQRYGFADRTYFSGSLLAPVLDGYLYDTGGEIDADQVAELVQWYIDLASAKAIYPIIDPTTAPEDIWQEWNNLFKGDHRPAMWVGGLVEPVPGSDGVMFSSDSDPWQSMAISQAGFVPFPVGEGSAAGRTTSFQMQCLSISAGSNNPRAAWAWIDFLSRQWLVRDQNEIWELQQVPARQSVAERVGYFNRLPAKAEEAVRFGISHAWFGSLYPNTLETLGQAVASHIAGNKDLDTAIADAMVILASIPQPTPDARPIVVASPPPPPPPGATVINFFTNRFGPGPEGDPIKTLAESYMVSHPDIYIKVSYDFQGRPDEDYVDSLAGNFDCFSWYEPYFMDQAPKPENLLSLNTLFSAEGSAFTGDFNPIQLDAFRHAGELYGLPAFSQTQIMSYNADLLAKRGLQPPANDWTFEDFIDLVQAASSTSTKDISYGFLSNEWDDLLLEGRGAKWVNIETDTPQALFDSSEMVATLNWMGDMVNSGALLVQKDNNWEEISKAFEEGRVAFWPAQIGEPWGYYMPYGQSPNYKIGVAPMPEMPSGSTYGGWANNIGLFISQKAQDTAACWDFIKYVSEQPTAFPGVPARRSINESPVWEAQVGPEFADVYRVTLSRIKPRSDMMTVVNDPISWPFYTWRSEAIRAVINGEQPRSTLETIQRKAEDYLACITPVDLSALSEEQKQQEISACAKQADPNGPW
jgi:ABC-type glycerol-3-phosphate transport system substrate-binding protein